jgi:predicted O-linked N-acetylglucosamine transferase (SPINDLY family)
VDLSGHTAGSRLTAFAYRPAPVQLSWLGYFATTGLRYIDAVLLDECHAPKGFEEQFVEEIVRLKSGRFPYHPVPWAPEVSSLPSLKSGCFTFGSFNNTGKLNSDVFDVWAKVLQAVPDSRLVLKWRTLVDEPLCISIYQAFESRGINASRIELRGASFHVDVLKEYADIDVALDPFPFTGGLTSCEALWMGVPVVTWPQSRVVSRQTFALLKAIGHTEWVAQDEQSYVDIALSLSQDLSSLANVRAQLRQDMRASSLMDVAEFTQGLEQTYRDLYKTIKLKEGFFVNFTVIFHSLQDNSAFQNYRKQYERHCAV